MRKLVNKKTEFQDDGNGKRWARKKEQGLEDIQKQMEVAAESMIFHEDDQAKC